MLKPLFCLVHFFKPLPVKGLVLFNPHSLLRGIQFGINECEQNKDKMKTENNIQKNYYGDNAPGVKDVLIVILVVLVLIVLDWIAYFKFGWLH